MTQSGIQPSFLSSNLGRWYSEGFKDVACVVSKVGGGETSWIC